MCFGEVITAMVTPFKEDGAVDYAKAQELALYLLSHGSDGVLVCGTTGENPTLTEEETETLYREVKAAVGDKGTVIAGAGGNDTAAVVRKIEKYNQFGLDGYLSVVPYYNKPTQEGLVRHFTAVNDAAERPVMLYNIPGRCGIKAETDTILRLAELKYINALKESTGSVDDLSRLLSKLPKEFAVYSGDDYMTFTACAMGAAGVVSVASHIVGEAIKEMVQCIKNDNLDRARELHFGLYPMFKGMFITANPIPVKTALNLLGFNVGGFRLPMTEATAEETETIRTLLSKYDLLS
ncbi:MAG: 4-hydroxy-tetrahydrodipicolinate synthase [Bacillota bacterium]|jgi:4-hydroxy-tetrahydrodipicolinate synthase